MGAATSGMKLMEGSHNHDTDQIFNAATNVPATTAEAEWTGADATCTASGHDHSGNTFYTDTDYSNSPEQLPQLMVRIGKYKTGPNDYHLGGYSPLGEVNVFRLDTCDSVFWNNPAVCNQHGNCIGSGLCECDNDQHWGGTYCGDSLCYSDSPGVACNTTTHLCDNCGDLWIGTQCETRLCAGTTDCGMYGTCEVNHTCTCDWQWTGAVCDVPTCHGGDCGSHGMCEDNHTCSCEWMWSGTECDVPLCGDECGSHGSCQSNHQCFCDSDWDGNQCDMPLCGGDECGDHGSCEVDSGSSDHVCTCTDSYTGSDCEVPPSNGGSGLGDDVGGDDTGLAVGLSLGFTFAFVFVVIALIVGGLFLWVQQAKKATGTPDAVTSELSEVAPETDSTPKKTQPVVNEEKGEEIEEEGEEEEETKEQAVSEEVEKGEDEEGEEEGEDDVAVEDVVVEEEENETEVEEQEEETQEDDDEDHQSDSDSSSSSSSDSGDD